MDEDKVIFSTQWIVVKESPRGFQYLERKGKDSVAVFLLRKSGKNSDQCNQCEVLIRHQHLCNQQLRRKRTEYETATF